MADGVFKEGSWAKLERPERLKDLNPEDTLIALGLKSGDSFADFGSGTGIFVVPALNIVGKQGRVYAVERSQALIDRMLLHFPEKPETLTIYNQDLMELQWKSEPVDYALMCHVAHELPDLQRFLHTAASAVTAQGKFSIIEWCVKEQPNGPPLHIRISPDALSRMLMNSGWNPGSPVLMGDDFYMITAVKAI